MKPPDKWATYCPDCKARIALDVTITEGPKVPGKNAVEARVKVDTAKMRAHMKDRHPERYPDQQQGHD